MRYFQNGEAPLEDVEAVYSASEESDSQVSVHEPTNAMCSSSFADSYELEDTDYRDGLMFDEYNEFQQKIFVLFRWYRPSGGTYLSAS